MAYLLLPGGQGEQGKKVHHIPNTSSTQWKALHSVNDFCFCFLLGNTYGVPLVIHGGAPGETTQKHTHSFSNMFLWQWKALHSVNDFYLESLGDPGKDGTDGVPGVNGTDGVPGVNGTDGVPGSKGR